MKPYKYTYVWMDKWINIFNILAEIYVHFYATAKIRNSALARGVGLGKILKKETASKWILKDEISFTCKIKEEEQEKVSFT